MPEAQGSDSETRVTSLQECSSTNEQRKSAKKRGKLVIILDHSWYCGKLEMISDTSAGQWGMVNKVSSLFQQLWNNTRENWLTLVLRGCSLYSLTDYYLFCTFTVTMLSYWLTFLLCSACIHTTFYPLLSTAPPYMLHTHIPCCSFP